MSETNVSNENISFGPWMMSKSGSNMCRPFGEQSTVMTPGILSQAGSLCEELGIAREFIMKPHALRVQVHKILVLDISTFRWPELRRLWEVET